MKKEFRKVVQIVVQPGVGVHDEDGNLTGMEQLPPRVIYYPFSWNVEKAIAELNRELEQQRE